jgi:predicted ATPase
LDNFVVISGCSGGGKSTLLEALRRLGHHVVLEPGRRIVKEELASGGKALPWADPIAFVLRAARVALQDRASARQRSGLVFFDRGLIDAASALQAMTGRPYLARLGKRHRYHRNVFLAPPWPETYGKDAERRHGFDEALTEYERLCAAFPQLGYEIHLLPKVSPAERAAFVLDVCRRTATA